MKRKAASFLNLDLELNATTDLSRLCKHFKGTAFVLYNGPIEGGYRLCTEPLIGGTLSKSLRACTVHFLEILETLPEGLTADFRRCKSRVFDYGFDGGLEAKPLTVDIPVSHLTRMARLDIQLRITVYPHCRDAQLTFPDSA